jgi:hypothetical protein
MKNSTLRELMFQISEIDETRNPFEIVLQMMNALRESKITFEQFKLLFGNLEIECQRYNIPTSNEICSLF